jgi:hypothetical protein
MPVPTTEIPLFKHLRELGEGARPNLDTTARRHHYVPSFLLARWARPQKRAGTLFELLVRTGQPRRTTPDRSAFETDLYAQHVDGESPNLIFEAYLSIIENYSAEPLKKLAGAPGSLNDEDRATLAYFIAYQQGRTPPAMAEHKDNAYRAAQLAVADVIGDWKALAMRYREKVDPAASDEAIAAFREAEINHFAEGTREIEIPPGAVLHAMLTQAPMTAAAIAVQDWTLLIAGDSEFIQNDRGIAMFDPTPRFPWSGNAWESSPNAQATVPLGPAVCLRMTPGSEGYAVRKVDAATVEEINLRSYGWADHSIFGTSQNSVTAVRRAAKDQPGRVVRPRVPRPVLLEPADPADERVGRENVARGWPRLLERVGPSGKRELFSYRVLDERARSGAQAKPEILEALRDASEREASN